ncbi:MAG: hypothetical protein JW829_06915 [Pirellulales bacterium]|nr:hypothetical protein [Pirellulales bacterium]
MGMLSDPSDTLVVPNMNGTAVWQDFGGGKPTMISTARNHTPGGSQSLLQQLGDDGGYGSDMILRLNNPIVGGIVAFTVWQFIESDVDFDGTAHVVISEGQIQPDGTGFDWGTHILFNGGLNQVETFCCEPNETVGGSIIKNRWVELKWIVDLNTQTHAIFYDGFQIFDIPWQQDERGNGDTFSSMNIWVDDGTTSNARVFYDDFDLRMIPEPASLGLILIAVLAGLGLVRQW